MDPMAMEQAGSNMEYCSKGALANCTRGHGLG